MRGRISVRVGLAALACLCVPAAQSQEIERTDAISRRVLVVNGGLFADASSRRILVVNGGLHNDTISRRVLVLLPAWSTGDAHSAIRVAAGLMIATQANMDRLDIVRDGDSAGKIDFRDAARLLRRAVGLDP